MTLIRPLAGAGEAEICAHMMCASEPWVTLRRDHAMCLRVLTSPEREVHVALQDNEVVGFVILCLVGAFVGYIQTVCVSPDHRNKGIGSELIRFSEDRILSRYPNVFMCVSSFNDRAARLYRRLGYEVVGELSDYIVRGHGETLLRKTIGPISTYAGG